MLRTERDQCPDSAQENAVTEIAGTGLALEEIGLAHADETSGDLAPEGGELGELCC